jgi:hypothetical protein
MEDLIILFLVVVLLVFSVQSTREHMKKGKEPELTPEDSMRDLTKALEKVGPKGTFALFNTQLKKYEDLIAHENDKDEE